MKAFKALIPFLTVGLLVACGKQATKNGSIPKSHGQETVSDGTGDWGGGNGIDNKVIERYAVDITILPEFKEILEPIGKHINSITPDSENSSEDEKAKDFLTVLANSKTWIFAPVSLEVIEKKRIGVEFSKDPIDQLAIQSDREVWIDSNKYQTMNKDEKAALLLHELMMAYYNIRFLPIEKLFLMSPHTDYSEFKKALELYPELAKNMAPEKLRRLEKNDYEFIRGATVFLLTKYKDLKSEKDMIWFSRTFNFDKRIWPEEKQEQFNDSVSFNISEKAIQETFDQLPYKNFFCNFNNEGRSQEKCRVSIGLKKASVTRQTEMTTGTKKEIIDIKFELNLVTIQKISRSNGTSEAQYQAPVWNITGKGAQACPSGHGYCHKYSLVEYQSEEASKALKVGDQVKVVDIYLEVSEGSENSSLSVDTLIPRTAVVSHESPIFGGTNKQLVLIPQSQAFDHSQVISRTQLSKQPQIELYNEPSWLTISPN